MNVRDDIPNLIKQLRVPASAALDERVLCELDNLARLRPARREFDVWEVIHVIVRNKPIRYAVASSLSLVLVVLLVAHFAVRPAWAIEQAIKALEKYKAVHMTGYVTAGGGSSPLEIWARSNASGSHSETCLAKSGMFTIWIKDNKTYTFDHAVNKVFVEPGITAGLNPWFGPRFMSMLAQTDDYQALEGHDPATGQARVFVTGAMGNALGPQSFLIEFDAQSKLPVSLKCWRNAGREGAADFCFERIVYFDDLPDSTFRHEPPAGVPVVTKPLTIPEANLAALSDPKCGIPADGMTREQACHKLLEQMWAAGINDDFARIRQPCPLTASASDGLLRALVGEDPLAEVLSIGGIEQEGQSPLGPLALVPSRVRCKDGKVREIRMVVQFRHTDQGTSCVVHGPHGYSIDVQ